MNESEQKGELRARKRKRENKMNRKGGESIEVGGKRGDGIKSTKLKTEECINIFIR